METLSLAYFWDCIWLCNSCNVTLISPLFVGYPPVVCTHLSRILPDNNDCLSISSDRPFVRKS